MAGKRQHYLPRFLSKGFNSKNKSKEPRSWVFTNDKVYETNLKNIGLQQYFCSGDLDLKVTDLEREFSKQIDNIRKLNSTTNIRNVEIISKLFYFQLIRTRNIRLTLRNIYNYSLTSYSEKIKKDFSQRNVIQKFRDHEQYKKLCKLIPQEQLEDINQDTIFN